MDEQQILKRKWRFIHIRKRSPLFWSLVVLGAAQLKNDVGFDYRLTAASFADHIVFDEKQAADVEKRIAKKIVQEPHFLLEVMAKGYNDHQLAIAKWEKIQAHDFSHATTRELVTHYQAYFDSMMPFGLYVVLPLLAETYMSTVIHAQLEKKFPKKGDTLFNVATDPLKEGSVMEEKLELLRIAREAKKGKNISNQIKLHTKKFCWMKNPGYFEEYYDEAHYLHHLKELLAGNPEKEINEMESHQKEKEKKFNELLALTKNEPTLQLLIKTANEAVYFRSYRTEIYYSSPTYLTALFKAIAQKLGLKDYRDLLYLYADETIPLLKEGKKAPSELISQRKIAYAIILKGESYTSIQGKAALELTEKLQLRGTHEKSEIVHGQSAYMGKVRGIAVVVHDVGELNKVKKGMILVAHATNVNFVPALKLVSGIVTEEGGILSHASIISRELKIPAVIGTKHATKTFKDGEMIEVDAEKGIVRKLS